MELDPTSLSAESGIQDELSLPQMEVGSGRASRLFSIQTRLSSKRPLVPSALGFLQPAFGHTGSIGAHGITMHGTLGLHLSHQPSSPRQQQSTLLEYAEEEDVELGPLVVRGLMDILLYLPSEAVSPSLLMTVGNTRNSCRG